MQHIQLLKSRCISFHNFSKYSCLIFNYLLSYREVFNTIAAEDLEFADDEDSEFEIPEFGKGSSSYDEVIITEVQS